MSRITLPMHHSSWFTFMPYWEKKFLNEQFFEGHEIIMMKDSHFSL